MSEKLSIEKSKEILLKIGMKETLFNKLSPLEAANIAIFALDHTSSDELMNMVIQLASMEIRNKKGASLLASDGVATVQELKNLTPEQLATVYEEYVTSQDEAETHKLIFDLIISNQQSKLSFHNEGSANDINTSLFK